MKSGGSLRSHDESLGVEAFARGAFRIGVDSDSQQISDGLVGFALRRVTRMGRGYVEFLGLREGASLELPD